MNNLNLDFLISTPREIIIKNVNHIFTNLLNEIHNYLGLEAINQNLKIIIKDPLKERSEKFFSLGVRRKLKINQPLIELSKKILKFIRIILLREAYLCFVPDTLKKKDIIQIVVLEVIENDLSRLEEMGEWKKLVRINIVNYNFLSSQFDKLNKFFKLEATEKTQSPTQFFFEFIRRNVSLIQDMMENFYDVIFEEFIYKTSKSLFNDEIIETIRILVKIFYHVKFFKNYSDYEYYFDDFIEKGIISTNLSKRKFKENLHWINNYTIVSPSYRNNWHKVNTALLISFLKFNPILNRSDIYDVLKTIPFLHNPIFSRKGFSEEIYCIFVIPAVYLKDLINFIENLHNSNYIVNKKCYLWEYQENFLNLNYFREYFKDLRKVINPNHKEYDTRFEIKCSNLYGEPHKAINMSLFDWLIFEKVSHASVTGFTFERKAETLHLIKDELLNHIVSEKELISDLKTSLNIFNKSPDLKSEILEFLDQNKRFGFFYIEQNTQKLILYLDLIENLIEKQPEIKNIYTLEESLKNKNFYRLIEENMLLKSKEIKKIIYRDYIPIILKSKNEFQALKKKVSNFYNFFEACKNLKIYNLNSMMEIISNEELPKKIYYIKEKKLRESFEQFQPYKITNKQIDSSFKRFLKAQLITPELINTIVTSSFAKYHPVILLKDSPTVKKKVDNLLKYFPRVLVYRMKNLFFDENVILLFTFFMNIKEKGLFCSIIYNIFQGDLLYFKRYFTSGIQPTLLIKEFYDFDRNEFFYTKDLFEQSFFYIKKVWGDYIKPNKEFKTTKQEKFWSKEKNVIKLVQSVAKRISYEQSEFAIEKINDLIKFNDTLKKNLLDSQKFKSVKQTRFFKTYIKSIKILPNFQAFGLNQYFLYFRPSNINEIDFKHILINSFQSIKYPAIADDVNSFLIKYIFPKDNPNLKHLNWYIKTKLIIQEYCLFTIKSIYQILNFNYNLSSNGWNYDSNRFKIYMQNILFNPDYKVGFSKVRQLNIEDSIEQNLFDPSSEYFQALLEIYNWKSIDIKSFLGTQKHSIIQNITKLITENFIFPYISLKNLEFQEKIYFILPNVKKELNSILIKIFNFFNYGFIYEIQGEFYIYNFNKKIKFENGLMIKLNMPQCELDEFFKLFDLLFKYFEINNYIILTDLVNGNNLLREIYGDLNFLNSYNPLLNLKWNDKDKIWMNHKLYTEKFEKVYPDLFYGVKS
ncbi:MAG: hypothetical protein ACFE9J_09300 [Candidatus Hermodarchaeota archaeon]